MIWLIGNKGMLGTELSECFVWNGMEFFGTDRECDIVDPVALHAACAGKNVRWIINCAAYTAVDKAEDEPELARRINAAGPGNIAAVAKEIGAKLIHISTDYVFDGAGTKPYEEDDPVGPTGMYGQTKVEGEVLVRTACPEHFILRTAWLYGMYGNNFVQTMLKLLESKDSIGVVADQRGSPTWARDLSEAIAAIVMRDSTEYGTYHFTDEGDISWHDFALEIQRLGLRYGILSHAIPVKPLR
ncbi:MAG: dTDP-4-dehydrorhamnose reductase, partial [Rectinemataceae bacterium]|nr:dTDP-4-dehydrorhamnose reductase [Rectinemataceae bacterium]